MEKTAVAKLLKYIRRYHSADDELIEYAEGLIEEERAQIVDAWVKGNQEGWNQTTDFPEDGEWYYEEKLKMRK